MFRNGVEWEAPEGSYPRYSEATLRRMDGDGRIVFGGKNPMAKRYLADVQEGRPPDTILDAKKVGFNRDGTRELRAAVLGEDKAFPQPKPVVLVKYLIDLVCDRDSLVLDFFAGSGTTGEAVLRANAADGRHASLRARADRRADAVVGAVRDDRRTDPGADARRARPAGRRRSRRRLRLPCHGGAVTASPPGG